LPRGLADSLERVTRSLVGPVPRADYLRSAMHEADVTELAHALDALAARAEQAEEPAREVLLSVVDALNAPTSSDLVQRLREEAAGASLLSLERLVRHPLGRLQPAEVKVGLPREEKQPDYGRGRPLTLGERKSLARRPDRAMMDRLFSDPHPDVIRGLLRNPKVTEDDVVRLVSRRPGRADVLTEVARSPKWVHRARVRLTLLLNPSTPIEIAAPITGLLVRQELKLVAEATHVADGVRALCLEHLERRPPGVRSVRDSENESETSEHDDRPSTIQ
jgi:hypothetical protein